MDGRQGCLVACVRTEPSTEKGVQRCQAEPDVAPVYRTHWTHWTQTPHYESQEATPPYLTPGGFLLMHRPHKVYKACPSLPPSLIHPLSILLH